MDDYEENQLVEIKREDGAFHTAVVVGSAGEDKVQVQYHSLFTDETRTTPLREVVDRADMRPEPPDKNEWNFHQGDKVDAFSNGAWRVGTLVGKDGPNYRISLGENRGDAYATMIRHHFAWDSDDNEWSSDYMSRHTLHGALPTAVASDHESQVGPGAQGDQTSTSGDSSDFFGPAEDPDSPSV